MRLTVQHRTSYRYTGLVHLEPHVIRLHPRIDATIRLVDYELSIDPKPQCQADNLDPEGNVITHAWFEGKTDHLTIETRAVVDTLVTDPFRFLIAEPDRALPYAYAPEFARRLEQYRHPPDAAPRSVRELALEAAHESKRNQATYSRVLAAMIQRRVALVGREDGEPQSPEETLETGQGACRDLATLLVDCCRSMGLAARFVSGYCYTGDTTHSADLHAWGEVFLRGGGWRGYDPSQGLAVADHHIALAAAAEPAAAAPLTGTYRGDDVTHVLETDVEVTAGR